MCDEGLRLLGLDPHLSEEKNDHQYLSENEDEPQRAIIGWHRYDSTVSQSSPDAAHLHPLKDIRDAEDLQTCEGEPG